MPRVEVGVDDEARARFGEFAALRTPALVRVASGGPDPHEQSDLRVSMRGALARLSPAAPTPASAVPSPTLPASPPPSAKPSPVSPASPLPSAKPFPITNPGDGPSPYPSKPVATTPPPSHRATPTATGPTSP